MAKKPSEAYRVPTKRCSIAQQHFGVSRQTTPHIIPSTSKKRPRLETESAGFHCKRFSGVAETHCSTRKRVSEDITGYPRSASSEWKSLKAIEAKEEKKQMMEMDHFKKMQCSVALKRLMVHREGWAFKKPVDGKALGVHDYSDIMSKPLLDLDTVKWKLEKGLYMKTNQFADDIRVMFSNAMLYYPVRHEIHKIAGKLSELFEIKWKFLEEKWEAEKAKGGEEKPKPLGKVRQGSVGVVKACGSITSKAGKKRKPVFELSNEENACPNSLCQALFAGSASGKGLKMTISDAELSTEKATDFAKPKQHLLDTILAAQSCLFDRNADLQRKKEREAARVMLQETKRTVFIDDNLCSFDELEQLCGHSLTDCQRVNPLEEILGLVLKDEFMASTHLDEEKFLGRDWEEGEIIHFD